MAEVKGSVNGKDPAVSFFFNDWQGGTMTLSRFLKGCYMDLLTAQFNNGHMSLEEIKTVLGSDFGSAWPALQKKFKQDSNGHFFNERLELETVKRKSFNKSRRDNLNNSDEAKPHMGNGIGNGIEYRKELFEKGCREKLSDQDPEALNNFLDYWTEHSENGKKMRFEMQKVFDVGRRFGTWKRNNFTAPKKESGLTYFEEQAKLAENL